MSIRLRLPHKRSFRVCFSLVLLTSLVSTGVVSVAQQTLKRTYPAGKNVRIELKNISGTIPVESWQRDEIKLSAVLEAPIAKLTPRATGESLLVDVMGENRGRGDVGNVNFNFQFPVGPSVDRETRQGNISVSNI